MPQGIPISQLISVSVTLTPQAAQFANFNTLLIIGDSDVINVGQRIRSYADIADIAADFGGTAPEYLAAELYFSQVPAPTNVYIGRWAKTATHGHLISGILAPDDQEMANFTPITNGGFHVTVDGGSPQSITGLNFSAAGNLNAVAAAIQAAMTGVTVTWNYSQATFDFKSNTTGAASSVSFLSPPSSGTDISGLLLGTQALGAIEVQGVLPESALQAVIALDTQVSQSWYGLMFAVPPGDLADSDVLAVAGYVQASGTPGTNVHIFGVTTTETTVLNPQISSDIASELSAALYTRTFCLYSENPYAVASMFGRMLTANFAMQNTAYTMMWKVLPGVVPEPLTLSELQSCTGKRCNVFVNYNNGTAIVQNGVMSGPNYIDEVHETDWFANQVQTDLYNILYTTPTKVPQTDAGTAVLIAGCENACNAAVTAGILAPGQWNSQGVGQIQQGDPLPKGYYIYAPPIATQAQADREARKSVPIQILAKLAGAIHTVDCAILVNR